MLDWLVEIRQRAEATQQEIANRSGISRQAISAIEKGIRRPSVDVAQKIAVALNFDWQLFFPMKQNIS